MADAFELRKKFAEGYEVMKERAADQVAALARCVDRYDRMLRVTGFRDEQVISTYPKGHVLGYLARTLFRLLVFLPLAVAGITLNIIPYQITGIIAGKEEKTPQLQSTMKIFGGAFIYPIAWTVEALLAGLLMGGWAALSVVLLAPLTGYIAMKFNEERESFWQESLTYFRLYGGRGVWNDLRERRRRLAGQVTALAEEYRRLRDTGTTGESKNE
jgi:hypothetical protein